MKQPNQATDRQQQKPSIPEYLGVQELPPHPWVYNKKRADGTYPSIQSWFDAIEKDGAA